MAGGLLNMEEKERDQEMIIMISLVLQFDKMCFLQSKKILIISYHKSHLCGPQAYHILILRVQKYIKKAIGYDSVNFAPAQRHNNIVYHKWAPYLGEGGLRL